MRWLYAVFVGYKPLTCKFANYYHLVLEINQIPSICIWWFRRW